MKKVDKSSFDNEWYDPGRSRLIQIVWYYINSLVFNSYFFPFYTFKRWILRQFGATIGKRFLIKPKVNIKYPWKLVCGDYVSLGENVWLDNLDTIRLDDNVTISQGAYLFCGNHNYKSSSFDLQVKPIHLEEGVWIGAKSIVCPGVVAKSHSVLAVNSVALKDMEPFSIYQGNPAVKKREREII